MNIKKVLELKQELYSCDFGDKKFEFRLLKIREFNLFNKLLLGGVSPFIIYDEVFEVCYLGHSNFLPENTPQGYIHTVGELIYNLSGGENGEEFLYNIAKARQASPRDSIYEYMKSTIFSAFSSLSLKDIEEMTEKEFINNFVASEHLLSRKLQGYQYLDLKKLHEEMFSEPEEKEVKQKQSEVVHSNHQLEKELGYWNVREAEDKFIKEEVERLKKIHGG